MSDHFTDVPEDNVHSDSIDWLYENDITKGTLDGTYGPSDPVTRDQMASFLRRTVRLIDPALAERDPVEPPIEPPVGVLWSDGFESGDISEWMPAISGRARAEVVTSPTHSGDYACKLSNWDVDGTHSAGARMTPNTQQWRPKESGGYPDDLYYSVWYYIPFPFEGQSNVFQFKASDAIQWNSDGTPREHTWRMVWKISLIWDAPADKYRMQMATRVRQNTGEWRSGAPDVLDTTDPIVPVGEWFNITTRYVWGQDETGSATVYLNGEQVSDMQNLSTEPNNIECMQWCRTWAVNHYLGDWQGAVAPGDSWLFIDDAEMRVPTETPVEPDILWNGDTETGDLRQWDNGPSISGSGSAEASTENPHTGTTHIPAPTG